MGIGFIVMALIATLVIIRNFRRHEVEDILKLEDTAYVDASRQCLLRLYTPLDWPVENHSIPPRIMSKLRRKTFRLGTHEEIASTHKADRGVAMYRHFFGRDENGNVSLRHILTAENMSDSNPFRDVVVIALVKLPS
ncbi:MAG: hypothetical protein WC767_02520 [Candidatus Paceibacterota bacterium]|jgi:hypothetical protein